MQIRTRDLQLLLIVVRITAGDPDFHVRKLKDQIEAVLADLRETSADLILHGCLLQREVAGAPTVTEARIVSIGSNDSVNCEIRCRERDVNRL